MIIDYSMSIIDYISRNYNINYFPTTFKILQVAFKYSPITNKNYNSAASSKLVFRFYQYSFIGNNLPLFDDDKKFF